MSDLRGRFTSSLLLFLALQFHPGQATASIGSRAIAPKVGDTLTVDTARIGDRLRPDEYLWAGRARRTITGVTPMRVTDVETLPAAVTAGIVAGSVTAIHIYQQNAWWANQRGPFYFNVAWGYAAQADKFGHMLAGNFTSYLAHEALVASGFSQTTAAWLGPTIGLAFMTYVEIEDGFGANWGFDPTDQYANTAGAVLFAAQQYLPWMQNVAMKWSYWPTGRLNQGEEGHRTIVVDDYNGQTVWFSFKMGNIVPASLGWPAWLRLAGGYGASNVDIIDSTGRLLEPTRRIYLALDYDLVELIPDLGSFGNWFIQTLDYLHLPAPALEVYPSVRFHLLYPLPL
jgi:hypothetical protein